MQLCDMPAPCLYSMLSKPTSHLGSTLPSGEHGHAVLELVMNEGRNHAYSLQYTPLLWQPPIASRVLDGHRIARSIDVCSFAPCATSLPPLLLLLPALQQPLLQHWSTRQRDFNLVHRAGAIEPR